MNAFLCAASLLLADPVSTAPERPWTFLVYGAADNNADGPILEFLDSVRAALDDDPGVELVLFIDRHNGFSKDANSLGEDFTGARIYRLKRGTAERIDPGADFPEIAGSGDPEVDSADPSMLGKFLAFGKKRFPAKSYGLMIYSHADGRGMCPDEESGGEMSIPEFRATVGAGSSVDFMGLELCNMAGIEVAYEWRPGNGGFSTNLLVAIPNAGPPLDWDRAFARIRSPGHAASSAEPNFDPAKMGAEDLGKLVVEEGHRGRRAMAERAPDRAERVKHEAAVCCDLAGAAAVKKAVDAFAVSLARTDAKKAFLDLRGPDSGAKVLDFAHGNLEHAPYFDLYDLCARAAKSEALAQEVRGAARAAAVAVDEFVLASFGMDGLAGFEAGKSGVFIVLPAGDAESKGFLGGKTTLWSKFRWYSPMGPEKESEPYGQWAFLADGAMFGNGVVDNWYELLDSWFDPDADGSGGLNGYRW